MTGLGKLPAGHMAVPCLAVERVGDGGEGKLGFNGRHEMLKDEGGEAARAGVVFVERDVLGGADLLDQIPVFLLPLRAPCFLCGEVPFLIRWH